MYCVAGSPSAITGSTNRARPSAQQQQQQPLGTLAQPLHVLLRKSVTQHFLQLVSEFLSPAA